MATRAHPSPGGTTVADNLLIDLSGISAFHPLGEERCKKVISGVPCSLAHKEIREDGSVGHRYEGGLASELYLHALSRTATPKTACPQAHNRVQQRPKALGHNTSAFTTAGVQA